MPGEFHGQRSLAGYSPRKHEESDTTELLRHLTRLRGEEKPAKETRRLGKGRTAGRATHSCRQGPEGGSFLGGQTGFSQSIGSDWLVGAFGAGKAIFL